jgi:hypothetical protein
MLHKKSVFQAAMILSGPVTSRLAAAAGTRASTQPISPWDVAVNSLIYAPDPVVTGLASAVVPIVAIGVGGLMFAFTKDKAERPSAAILFAAGVLIGAANILVCLLL